MADGTKIEWTDATWNPITGCSVVSPGCTNCYAMRLAGTRMKNHPSRVDLTDASKAGPVWNGTLRWNAEWLEQPLRWRKPRMIFVCAHGDLFHESAPLAWIDKVFAVMALAPRHTFQVLTKRAEVMRDYLRDPHTKGRIDARMAMIAGDRAGRLVWPIPNVWLGVSVEDQKRAEERIPQLLQTPAAVRWISAEPLLGPVDLRFLQPGDPPTEIDALAGTHGVLRPHRGECGRVDWVVAGGESGPGARPAHPDWFRSLRDQCALAEVPFLFKQWGDWIGDDIEFADLMVWHQSDPDDYFESREVGGTPPTDCTVWRVGKKRAGRHLDGRTWDQFPEVSS